MFFFVFLSFCCLFFPVFFSLVFFFLRHLVAIGLSLKTILLPQRLVFLVLFCFFLFFSLPFPMPSSQFPSWVTAIESFTNMLFLSFYNQCIYARIHIGVCWLNMRIGLYIYIYIYIYMHTHAYACIYIYIYIYMCVCVCVCVRT